jgi:MYXO-CTERM domain-containing protein
VDVLEDSFLGLVGEPGEIRRVNLWIAIDTVPGADNIVVYEVPEPGAATGAGVALLALGALAGRSRRAKRHSRPYGPSRAPRHRRALRRRGASVGVLDRSLVIASLVPS